MNKTPDHSMNWEVSAERRIRKMKPSTGLAILTITSAVSFGAGVLVMSACRGEIEPLRKTLPSKNPVRHQHPDAQKIQQLALPPQNHDLLYTVEEKEPGDEGVEL